MNEEFSKLELKFQAIDKKIVSLKADKWRDQEGLLVKSVDRILDFERIAEDLNDKREVYFDVLSLRTASLIKSSSTTNSSAVKFEDLKPKLEYFRYRNLDDFDEDEFEILLRENRFFKVSYKRDFQSFRKLQYLTFYNAFNDSKEDI